MADTLRRFVARSPRYVLRPSDNQMLRYAPNKSVNQTFSTRFVDVSETGLAFVTDPLNAPKIGELLKIEFPVPGGEQIAWFAKVVRLEQFSDTPWWSEKDDAAEDSILVGVQFHELPNGHRMAIREHLHERFSQIVQENRQRRWRKIAGAWRDYGWQLFLYVVSALVTFSVLYWLSRPTPTYDERRGAPWGQRFKLGE